MGRRRLTHLGPPIGALVALLLAVFLITPAQAAGPSYVALGDSYSSGVGTSGESGLCLRSPQGYPTLWASAHQTSLHISACSGAVTSDVRDYQLDYLGAATRTVTITIGGNDVGFADAMLTCTFESDASCLAAVAKGTSYAENTLPASLDATYADIRAHAPNAAVYVLGYPRLFEETASCSTGPDLTDRRAINQAADELTTVTAGRAAAAGFHFVDVRAAFAGHGICASTPWINAFGLTVNSFHPTADGYRYGYLPALTAVTG